MVSLLHIVPRYDSAYSLKNRQLERSNLCGFRPDIVVSIVEKMNPGLPRGRDLENSFENGGFRVECLLDEDEMIKLGKLLSLLHDKSSPLFLQDPVLETQD